tara:strand:- start:12615 stop:13115 length:501 start_codon:yes stop_codon:yes gene_type:complete
MNNLDTLFLDRDGVINKKLEGRYVSNFSEFKFMKGAIDAIAKLTIAFNRIIIITNQQGIGKEIMSNTDLHTLHAKMERSIEVFGGKIDKIYYCPHLENVDCKCRKPKTGMIQHALLDFPKIVIEKSYLVGDSESDIEAGKKMGLKTIKVDNEFTLSKWTDKLISSI